MIQDELKMVKLVEKSEAKLLKLGEKFVFKKKKQKKVLQKFIPNCL